MSSYAPHQRRPKKKKEEERADPKIQHIRNLAVKYVKENQLSDNPEKFAGKIVDSVLRLPHLLTMNGRFLIEASLLVDSISAERGAESRKKELGAAVGHLEVPLEIGGGGVEEAKKRSDAYRASLLRYGFAIIESQESPTAIRYAAGRP